MADLLLNNVKLQSNVNSNGFSFSSLSYPTSSADAATKGYVDATVFSGDHADLTNVTSDQHHANAHSIVSHSDTTATGAELETLTDNSIADTLHRHSELVASDGSPDPAVTVDATGRVGIGTTSPESKMHTVDEGTNCIRVEESTGNTGSVAGMLFRTSGSATRGFFKGGILYEDDGTSFARGKLHLVQNNEANVNDAGIGDAALTIDQAGNVGIGSTNPSSYTLDVSGTARFTGKVTHSGGTDPKYVHYERTTLEQIIGYVKRDVPPSKLNGVVEFYAKINDKVSKYALIPDSGKVFDIIEGTLATTISPITESDLTTTYITKYEILSEVGLVLHEVVDTHYEWKLKEGYILDENTGVFTDSESNVVTEVEALEHVLIEDNVVILDEESSSSSSSEDDA